MDQLFSCLPGAALTAVLLFFVPAASAVISPDEQRVLDAIDARRALADIEWISHSADGIAQGVGAGSVVAGSPEEAALAADIAQTFRGLGLEVRIEEFPVRAYRYAEPKLLANGKPVPAIALHATGAVSGRRDGVDFARGNEAEGRRLRLGLVDAGDGYAPDYDRIGDVRGKAVLVRRDLRDWPPAQITEAAHRGARAIVFFDHPASGDRIDALRQDSLWGHEQLPTVAISIRSARALQAELVAGAVEIALESRVEIGDGRSRNVIGVLRGTESPDQWVVVSGHYDRWFQGALDNASGTAAVLEMARAFTGSGIRPARSLLFMAVGSEEAGLEDPERDWLAGSHAFLLANPEVTRKAALVFNLDGVGWTPAAAKLSTTPDILAGQRAVIADLGLAEAVEARALTGSSIDAWNFGVLGGAATNALITWDPSYSPLYHTQEDVFLAGRFANMPRDLSIVGLSLARAATEARPEVRLTALADFVVEQLAVEAKPLAGVSLADIDEALTAFRAAAAAVATAGAGERGDAAARTLMLVRRALVPWLYAANGEFEQSVRIAEYAHRVAALDTAMEALRKEDRQGALEAIGTFYEGRQCQRLSPEVYAIERSFWAGEGGWSSRFGHRAPPPLPAFDAACRALAGGAGPPTPAIAGFEAARAEALLAAEQSLALMAAKLHVAAAELQAFIATGVSR